MDVDTTPPSPTPLAGARVLVARASAQAPALARRIETLGGEAVNAPVLRIEPGDGPELVRAVRGLAAGRYAWVCLTSPNGVDALADAVDAAGLDARAFAAVGTVDASGSSGRSGGVAAVGGGTARRLFERLALRADLVPPRATTTSLGEALPAGTGRVLLPRADIANPRLPELVAAAGYEVDEVVAYRTVRAERLDQDVVAGLREGTIDLVALGSPSTARNLVALLDGASIASTIVSIGPVTSAECVRLGLEVAAEADPHDLDGLVAAVVAAHEGR